MTDTWLLALLGGVFALFLGRSAIIAIWPDSEAAKVCEHKLGFMDHVGDSDGGDGDCGGDGGGGD
jgi:hypothetical protein